MSTTTGSGRQTKRPFYRRTRDGCSTCRQRKVKCDETKPECNRCTSAGYKCDGYSQPLIRGSHSENTTASRPSDIDKPSTSSVQAALIYSTHQAIVELKVALPRTNVAEVRSYHFFLDMAAPSLAGVFDGDFWMSEIPRACFVDQAVWHAVVSLGAVYESFLARSSRPSVTSAVPPGKDFALQQCNLAIRFLTNSPDLESDKWRTLTASVLFTYICSLQDLQEQAFMHLTAGHKIIQAMVLDGRYKRLSPGLPATPEPSTDEGRGVFASPDNIPISLATLQAVIANIESHRQALDHGGLNYEETRNHTFNVWLSYRNPSSHYRGSSLQYAMRPSIVNANRAAESLLYGLMLYSQVNSDRLAAVVGKGDMASLEVLISGQEPYKRCFTELHAFVQTCTIEADTHAQIRSGGNKSIQNALLSLRLLLATIRLLLLRNPDKPEQPIIRSYLCAQFQEIVRIAQQVLQTDDDRASFIPTPHMTQSLFLVAHSGFPQSIRRRAISLLRAYPRCAGVWDTMFSAALADMMMKQEKLVLGEKVMTPGREEEDLDDDEEVVNLLYRVYRYRISFQGGRRAVVAMHTWRDFLGDLPETSILLTW
ncbi:hypothetical protein F4782DRAFT_448188 [Xylaria castorea]|nr:hypothetical protein F4782DRAFT_448188 [Xylaria castorea]